MNTATNSITPTSEILQTFFHLPPETIQICDKYYILYWESRYLYTQLLRNQNRVIRERISYVPIFQDDLTFEELGANPELQVKVSFRRLKGKIGGYVLIGRTHRGIDTPIKV